MARKRRRTTVVSLGRVNGQGPTRRTRSRHKGGTRSTILDQVGASTKTAWSRVFGNPRKSTRWL